MEFNRAAEGRFVRRRKTGHLHDDYRICPFSFQTVILNWTQTPEHFRAHGSGLVDVLTEAPIFALKRGGGQNLPLNKWAHFSLRPKISFHQQLLLLHQLMNANNAQFQTQGEKREVKLPHVLPHHASIDGLRAGENPNRGSHSSWKGKAVQAPFSTVRHYPLNTSAGSPTPPGLCALLALRQHTHRLYFCRMAEHVATI